MSYYPLACPTSVVAKGDTDALQKGTLNYVVLLYNDNKPFDSILHCGKVCVLSLSMISAFRMDSAGSCLAQVNGPESDGIANQIWSERCRG